MNLENIQHLDAANLLALLINNEDGLPKIKVTPLATSAAQAPVTMPLREAALGILGIDTAGDLAVQIGLHTTNGSAQLAIPGLQLEQLFKNLLRLTDSNQTYVRAGFNTTGGCIQSFAAGTSFINFENTGGDNWNITHYFNPPSTQLPNGVTIVQITGNVAFYSGGSQISGVSQADSADVLTTQTNNGAGVYMLSTDYELSNGGVFSVSRAIKVNASGTILQDIQQNGSVVNSTGCLTLGASAQVIQTNYNGQIQWLWTNNNFSQVGNIGTGESINGIIGTNAAYIVVHVVLDSSWNDLPANYLGNSPQFNYFHTISLA